MTWHCRACGQVGRVLQVANLQPEPVPAPVLELDLEPEPEPDPVLDMEMEMEMEPPRPPDFPVPDGETFTTEEILRGSWAPGAPEDPEPLRLTPVPDRPSLLDSLRDAWTGETSRDREAKSAGIPRDLLDSLDAAADQVARETRAPRKGDR